MSDQPNAHESEKVKRYQIDRRKGIPPYASTIGPWCKWDDYEALLKERDELKNKLQQACDVIGGVAMELSKLRVERNALQKDNCEMRDLISNAGIHI